MRVILGALFWSVLVSAFMGCGDAIHEGGTSTTSELSQAETVQSQGSFETTLFPILQTNCLECHGKNQQPRFAVTNVQESHDTLINLGLVNLPSPSSSRLVAKINGGHQNFPNSLGTDIELAIIAWAAALQNTGGGGDGSGGGVLPAPPELEATFSSIHALILIPKCVGCHSLGGERPQEDYSTFATTLKTVTPGDANDSSLYTECSSGSMPENAPNLSPEELTVLRDWINQGAQNN